MMRDSLALHHQDIPRLGMPAPMPTWGICLDGSKMAHQTGREAGVHLAER